MEKTIEIGQIVNTRGLRGELKVQPWCDDMYMYDDLSEVILNDKGFEIENVKYHKNCVLLTLKGINTIEEAEKYRNVKVVVNRADLGELPEGVHYICDLLGCRVVTLEGRELGIIDNVIKTGSNDVYELKSNIQKNLLIPVIDDVVKEIDVENKIVKVELLKGLIDE